MGLWYNLIVDNDKKGIAMENLNNLTSENTKNTSEGHPLENYDEFNPARNRYNVVNAEAKSMVDPHLCPESMWKPLQDELINLSGQMIEWHEKNDGTEVSEEAAAAYRKLDDDRADIAVRILPDEAGFDDINSFYSKLDEAAKLKREIESNNGQEEVLSNEEQRLVDIYREKTILYRQKYPNEDVPRDAIISGLTTGICGFQEPTKEQQKRVEELYRIVVDDK